MVAPNFNSLCKEAELYYCDFLCKEGHELVPEFIIDHIKQCQCCQEQLSRLTRMLSIAQSHIESEEGQISSAITMMLKLHLAYIGKPITCETVKPFLPSLLDPALKIGIPTPITIHLDNCRECSEDLETIRRLNLSRRQLHRLSQLFADEPAGSNISCTEAQNAIPSAVSIVFSETDSEVLKHLCICRDCRGLLYQRREMVLRGLLKTNIVKNKFPCEEVSARDFFDYVIPYGIDTANDQYAKFRESLASHLRTCPTCLAKMQQLHDTVYGIVERTESEVVTIYHIDESAKVKTSVESDDLYAGFPIKVEVIGQKDEVKAEQPVPAIDFAATLKQRISVKKLKPLLKTGAVAAAVIFIAVALLLNAPTAKAVTLSQIYEALEKVKNVYISRFVPGETGPTQEKWVSRTLNIYMTKTAKQCVLWDVASGVTKVKYLDTGAVETTRLSVESITDIEKKMSGYLGLVPFTNMSEIPADAQWSRVIDKSLEASTEDIEIYDLMWAEGAYEGSVVFKKWRFFVNPQTNLPQKTEFSEKLPTDDEYVLESTNIIEYLSGSELQVLLKEASF
ncbi:MAG: hypothetical protein ABSG99_04800 [Sedimentisphaerales bacterium]